jgi:hypothetical protein
MYLPSDLSHLINESLKGVESHPQHELNLGYRYAIYAFFGPKSPTSGNTTNQGHRRRTKLALLSIQHVLSLWEKVRPFDRSPHLILEKVQQILEGVLTGKQVDQMSGLPDWGYMDNVSCQVPYIGSSWILVGYGAVKTIGVAIWDEIFDPTQINPQLTDDHLDTYDLDVASEAAAGYAGGFRWKSESDQRKRRQFWEWWLTEAVPKAWAAFP